MKRERIMYAEKYRARAAAFRPNKLPTTNHTQNDIQPCEGYLMQVGAVQRGDEELEFHDIRLYFKAQSATHADRDAEGKL